MEINFSYSRSSMVDTYSPYASEESALEYLDYLSGRLLQASRIYVPVDSGDLMASGIKVPIPRGFSVEYRTSYAAYVHEMLNLEHRSPERAKFLTYAFHFVMMFEVSRVGADFLPEFNVEFKIDSSTKYIALQLTLPQVGVDGLSWRRFRGEE